jgi:hypothetical protein
MALFGRLPDETSTSRLSCRQAKLGMGHVTFMYKQSHLYGSLALFLRTLY